jgi:hypothetical protein
VHRSISVEVTFVGIGSSIEPAVEGVVRMPDGTRHAFCGWIDLLGVLERAAAGAGPRHDDPAAVT